MPLKKSNDDLVKKLFEEHLNDISSDENSDAYLRAEGLDPNSLVDDGLRKLKQFKMKMASAKTETTYTNLTASLMDKAREEVKRLMEMANFDFAGFVKREGVVGAFRNLDTLSKEEMREFLERHILLKLQQGNEESQKTD